jgi:hypothetical protein
VTYRAQNPSSRNSVPAAGFVTRWKRPPPPPKPAAAAQGDGIAEGEGEGNEEPAPKKRRSSPSGARARGGGGGRGGGARGGGGGARPPKAQGDARALSKAQGEVDMLKRANKVLLSKVSTLEGNLATAEGKLETALSEKATVQEKLDKLSATTALKIKLAVAETKMKCGGVMLAPTSQAPELPPQQTSHRGSPRPHRLTHSLRSLTHP